MSKELSWKQTTLFLILLFIAKYLCESEEMRKDLEALRVNISVQM